MQPTGKDERGSRGTPAEFINGGSRLVAWEMISETANTIALHLEGDDPIRKAQGLLE
jgi:hypothetical protein